MASEARRGAFRIGANYSRLSLTLLLGLVLVPTLLSWVGREGFGVIALLLATSGVGGLAEEVTRQSMIRELGAAHHSGSSGRFRRTYNSAYILAAGSAAVCALGFGVLLLALPLLRIPADLFSAAMVIIAAEGVFMCLRIMLAPVYNMYVVQERFGAENMWSVATRASHLVAALLLWKGLGIDGIANTTQALTLYGMTAAGLKILVLLSAVIAMMASDRRLVPLFSAARRSVVRRIVGTFGWNSAVSAAYSMHERVPALIMNLAFGAALGNVVWGIAIQLAAYVRMASVGMTLGLEAVATRLSSNQRKGTTIAELTTHSTRLHAAVALPAATVLLLLTEPVLSCWIGARLDEPERMIPLIAVMSQILLIPIMVRSISDGWIRILYGAGFVRRYAPLVLLGGFLNPVVGIGLVLTLPDPFRFNAPAIAYALVYTTFHFILVPSLASRCMGISTRDMLAPVLRPLIVTLACVPIVLAARGLVSTWTAFHLAGTLATVGAVYFILSWIFVLSAQERHRFAWAARRNFGRRAGPLASTGVAAPPGPRRSEPVQATPTGADSA